MLVALFHCREGRSRIPLNNGDFSASIIPDMVARKISKAAGIQCAGWGSSSNYRGEWRALLLPGRR